MTFSLRVPLLGLVGLALAGSASAEVRIVGTTDEAKVVPYRDGMTLTQALAGSTRLPCALARVTSGKGPTAQSFRVDIPGILVGWDGDFVLREGDTVFLPEHVLPCMNSGSEKALIALIDEFVELNKNARPLPPDWQARVKQARSGCSLVGKNKVFAWQESRDEKTGKKQSGFYVAPQRMAEWMLADIRGEVELANKLEPKNEEESWAYGLLLTGGKKSFRPKDIKIFSVADHELVEVVSGKVEVNDKDSTVRIELEISFEGKVGAFPGNGVYVFAKTEGLNIKE